MAKRRKPEEDTRDAKDLSPAENADLCAGCVKCCTYITVEIDTPRSAWEYDQWIWALHHEAIEIFVEKPESWFLLVETRCRHLGKDGRCGVYSRRPFVCRDYDPRSCERRLPLQETRAWFRSGEEMESWLERERPSHYRRLLAYRKDHLDAPAPAAAASFVPLMSLAAPRPERVRKV